MTTKKSTKRQGTIRSTIKNVVYPGRNYTEEFRFGSKRITATVPGNLLMFRMRFMHHAGALYARDIVQQNISHKDFVSSVPKNSKGNIDVSRVRQLLSRLEARNDHSSVQTWHLATEKEQEAYRVARVQVLLHIVKQARRLVDSRLKHVKLVQKSLDSAKRAVARDEVHLARALALLDAEQKPVVTKM